MKVMKIKNIIRILAILCSTGLATTSCEDMLTIDTGDKIYVNANDTLYSYLGILKHVQDIAERQVILNEVRGDLCSPSQYVTDTLHAIANFDNPSDGSCSMLDISDYYAVINNCNLYIANADTNAVKNNVKFMLPEYAQVQAIRAWTYLKLVEMYGEVPFISEPIASLDVVKNFNYQANLVNKDNLLDRLLALGLTRYIDTDYPNYGNYNNGAVDISSSLCFFPVRLVLGDLYLLRGNDESDYRKAAQYYFDYLQGTSTNTTQQYCLAQKTSFGTSGNNPYGYTAMNGWGNFASSYTKSASSEVITIIPSSANKQFGTMLMRVADIFGYTPSSRQNDSEVSTDDSGNESVSTSGAISVTPTYRAQILASESYKSINKAQTYVNWDITNTLREDYECGDARYASATQSVVYEGNTYQLACKAAKGRTFYYSIPVYRKSLVWLRLAEAINRAGYPSVAFAILKDGLNRNNCPDTKAVKTETKVHLDEDGNALLDENGAVISETLTVQYTRYNSNGAMHYVDSTEMANFFLDFNDEIWDKNYGIHARGCGYLAYYNRSFSTWPSLTESPVTNITGYNDSTAFDFKPRLEAEGIDWEHASKADIINAVENVISDELALELAFEGYRFSDLVRMATHKNASGYDGTDWLASKIADRDNRQASDDGSQPAIMRNEALYSKLHNTGLWYFTKPAWNVK